MSENKSGGECFLEGVESIITEGVEIPWNVLPGETCQWNNNVQIVKDELAIEISETWNLRKIKYPWLSWASASLE